MTFIRDNIDGQLGGRKSRCVKELKFTKISTSQPEQIAGSRDDVLSKKE